MTRQPTLPARNCKHHTTSCHCCRSIRAPDTKRHARSRRTPACMHAPPCHRPLTAAAQLPVSRIPPRAAAGLQAQQHAASSGSGGGACMRTCCCPACAQASGALTDVHQGLLLRHLLREPRRVGISASSAVATAAVACSSAAGRRGGLEPAGRARSARRSLLGQRRLCDDGVGPRCSEAAMRAACAASRTHLRVAWRQQLHRRLVSHAAAGCVRAKCLQLAWA